MLKPSLHEAEVKRGLIEDATSKTLFIRNEMRTICEQSENKTERTNQIERIPEFLGKGENGFAFLFHFDGEPYVIKMHPDRTMEGESIALQKGVGIDHIPQLLSYIPDTAALVMSFVPGTPMDRIVHGHEPTSEDMSQLVGTIVELNKNGLGVDPRAANFLFDPEKGIGIVDIRESSRHSLLSLPIQLYHASACIVSLRKLLHPDTPIAVLKREIFIEWLRSIKQGQPEIYSQISMQIQTGMIPGLAVVRIPGLEISPELAIECVRLVDR